jgi:hypothetical protein
MTLHLLLKGAMMGLVVAVPVGPPVYCASIEHCRWVRGMAFFPAWVSPRLMTGHYGGAAVFAVGVFIGSASWWVALFLGLTVFRERFNLRLLWWIHRISGGGIAVFGVVLLLSISPLSAILGNTLIEGS